MTRRQRIAIAMHRRFPRLSHLRIVATDLDAFCAVLRDAIKQPAGAPIRVPAGYRAGIYDVIHF